MSTIGNSTSTQTIITTPNGSTQQTGGVGTDPKSGMGNLGNTQKDLIPNPGAQTKVSAPVVLSSTDLQNLEAALRNNGVSNDAGSFDYSQITSLIGKMMIQFAASQREQALNQRLMGYEQAKNAALDQAGELTKSAEKMDKGANISMGMAIGFGALSLAGSAVSLGKQVSSMRKADAAAKNVDDASEKLRNLKQLQNNTGDDLKGAISNAKQDLMSAQAKSGGIEHKIGAYKSAGELVSRFGDMGSRTGQSIDTKEQAKAKQDEAQGSRDAAESTIAQQRADQAKEVQQARDDMVKAILNFIKEMQDSKVEMMRAITRS